MRLPYTAKVQLIGLTGGIASGKSTIGRHLERLGAVRIDADELAREAVSAGSVGLRQIVDHFGPGVLSASGELDRAGLGTLVFADTTAREALNGIVHPQVRALAEAAISRASAADPDAIVVYEIPLLVETARVGEKLPYDLVVVADAPAQMRVDRLVQLRGLSVEEATRRIQAQASDDERRAVADVLIDTSGTEAHTLDQVEQFWRRLRS